MSSLRSHLALLAAVLLVCACSGAPMAGFHEPASPGEGTAGAGSGGPGPGSASWLPVSGDEPEPGFAPWARADARLAARTEVLTDPGELPSLKVAADGNKPLPLQHTKVTATLSGFTADVEVAQTYSNPYTGVIEASYVFPLPENAAVYSMKMVIGARTIEAVVKERGAARRTYESAKAAGHTAALLEQERPNVFTQSVANIEPGTKIDVVLRYVQDLSYDDGEYELVFPMVVGPRYIPGAPLAGPPSGNGTYADTDAVPDASRITPPVLGKGERSGHDISLSVVASAAGAVSSFSVPTHEVITEPSADGALRLRLSNKDKIPNRDFVLRYRVAGEEPKATLYAAGKEGGFFSLVVHPPVLDVESLVGRRELVFVVDVSGSMRGAPLSLCKTAMREALSRMRPVDTFNVIIFAGATGKMFPRPRPANAAAIREALAYVDGLTAGGGTEMLDAIGAALSPDVEKGRHRYVFFLTDGYVGNEDQILSATREFVSRIEDGGQRARVFGFGAGSSVNRMLLDGLGKHGKGLTVYATSREHPERAVNRFYRYIDRSVLRDVTIDFGALKAKDVFPAELPDLFASHPLIVHGRFDGALAGPVVVRAKGARGPVEIPVTIARAPMDDGWPLQGLLWARSKVGSLERDLWDGGPARAAQSAITELGIQYHLVTAFTSFVAVDTSKKVGDGRPAHVVQPVETPEGVDGAMAGARTAAPNEVEYGYEFSDEPLASGGFGPNDATLRVRSRGWGASLARPGPVQEQASVVVARRGPRGCTCGLAGERSAGRAWVALVALGALGAAFAARRAREGGRRGRGSRAGRARGARRAWLERRGRHPAHRQRWP